MLRNRILAAATATILALGMSVGGVGTAFAGKAPTDVDLSVAIEAVKTEKVTTVEVTTEKVKAEKVTTSEVTTENVTTEKVVAVEVPTEKVAAEEVATKKVSTEEVPTEKVTTDEVATTKAAPLQSTIAGVSITDQNGLTCDKAGYIKPDLMNRSSGTYSDVWGSVVWAEYGNFTWTLKAGYDVDFCVKGANFVAGINSSEFQGNSYNFSAHTGHGISHTGFRVVAQPTEPPVSPPCLPSSAVSYTYINSGDLANTGVVTVTQRYNHSNQLCEPLYVTAAAWAFDNVNNIWTQTLVDAQHINGGTAITTVGEYSYGVAVGCGQGDIYASRTAFPKPSPYLNGPNQPAWPVGQTPWPFTETFLHDMGFSGPNPTWVVTNPGCNALVPVAPSVTVIDACGEYGSIVLDSSTYITYIVKNADGNVVAPESAQQGKFTVTAVATFPYILKEYPMGGWTADLKMRYECPVAPTASPTPENCVDGDGTITFSNVAGIASYSVTGRDGSFKPGDTLTGLVADTYKVTAVAATGSVLEAGSSPFDVEVAQSSEDCVVATAAVTLPKPTCELGQQWKDSTTTATNASFGEVSFTNDEYAIVATAKAGHLFSDGTKTLTFTGKLAPADASLCATVTAEVAVTTPSCFSGSMLDEPEFAVSEGVEWSIVDDGQTGGSYEVLFTAPSGSRFENVSQPGRVVSNGGTTLTVSGTLAGPTPELCTVLGIVNPFRFVDTCTTANFTLVYVEGLTYSVTINGEPPFDVDFADVVMVDGERAKTTTVNPGDFVSAKPRANEGYILDANQPTPLDHQFEEYPEGCQLPELPNWPASVTGTNQVCTALGMSSGAITVQLSVGPEGNDNPVRYYLAFGTAQQQELTRAVTPMSPGEYVVTAVASIPTDSVNDGGNTVSLPVKVGAVGPGGCDLPPLSPPSTELSTLAFTGVSDALAGIGALALLLMLVGAGAFAARRHVA